MLSHLRTTRLPAPPTLRRRALLGALALVAGVLGVGARAEANDGGRWKVVDINFGVEGYDFPSVEQLCDASAPTNCVVVASEPGFTLTGDLAGTGVEARTASAAPTNISIIRGVGTFSGRVKGCGTGTFVYTEAGRFDGTSNTFKEVYTISPGTGTGDLDGITGAFVGGSGPVRCRRR